MLRPWEKYYTDRAKEFDAESMPYKNMVELINGAGKEFATRPFATTILPNGATATINYNEFLDNAKNFAVYLKERVGLKTGETVALMSPNCIDFTIAAAGAFLAGGVCTNINPLYTEPELEHQLNDSNAKVLVIIDMFGDKVDAVVKNTPVDKVITISLLEFFPTLKKLLIGFVLRRVKKVIPTLNSPHVKFDVALSEGSEARKARSIDVSTYASSLLESDTALYQYTSGTTGRSKGAELSHRSILANGNQATSMVGDLQKSDGDTVLVALPLYHITAFALIFVAGINNGSHLILVPSPRPPSNLKSTFETFNISWLIGINTLFAALMEEPWFNRDLFNGVNFCGSGGAAQHTGVARRWEELTGVEIYQGYGMTECSGVLSLNPIGDNRLGSVGVPVPGMDVKIIDNEGKEADVGSAGEVIFRGPTIMKGYLGHPEATAEALKDGWLYSGDIGIMDEDGFIEIVDRKKDMILVSGFNVSPNEVEDFIATLEGVVEVGVIGVSDERSAERPMAFVVGNSQELTEDVVISHCRQGLASYKVPTRVEFVDEIPKSPVGKVLRRELRDMA